MAGNSGKINKKEGKLREKLDFTSRNAGQSEFHQQKWGFHQQIGSGERHSQISLGYTNNVRPPR